MENEEIMNSLHKPEQEYCMILSESMLHHPPINQALQHHDMNAAVVDYGTKKFACFQATELP